MSKSQTVREALLAGEELCSRDFTERFGLHSSMLANVVKGLKTEGTDVAMRRDGRYACYQVVPDLRLVEETGTPPPRPHQPQPGDRLLVKGLFLDDTGEIEVQASGSDGTYLLRVIAHRPGKTRG